MGKKIRIGTRDSVLALIQTNLVAEAIKKYDCSLEIEIVPMKTTGDKILDKTLDKIGGKGLFVKELDLALKNGVVDITVSSGKDLPMELDPDLPVVAWGKREDPRDVLVLSQKQTKESLPLGCSSLRRSLQLQKLLPQEIQPVRGNIQTRMKKMEEGQFSGLVLAAAGLKRLGMEKMISRYFSPEEVLPAACQGMLAVQARKGEDVRFLECFQDSFSLIAATAERAFVSALHGGCSSPVAAYCTETADGEIFLRGIYYDEDNRAYFVSGKGGKQYAQALGEALANRALSLKRNDGTGKVTLVGAGPGDSGLMTLKGKTALDQADVVVYDRLVSEEILSMIPETAEKINVGKESNRHPVPQESINGILLKKAMAGKNVVRLKGGDPFLFGRGGEELELLEKNDVPFEVVPGITSSLAAPAYGGIPVTHRDYVSSLHIITGHRKKDHTLSIAFDQLVKLEGTLVFLMGVSSLEYLMNGLLNAGMSPEMPAAVIENGTRPFQRKLIATVSTLAQKATAMHLVSPSVIVVGKVCNLSQKFDFFMKKPLFGCKVIVTRPKDSVGELKEKLWAQAAEVIDFPCIEIEPIHPNPSLRQVFSDFSVYDWILFTSKNGVQVFFEFLQEQGMDARNLSSVKIAAVGKKTGEALYSWGIRPDFVPQKFDGKTLGETLPKEENGKKVLLLDALQASQHLRNSLEERGISYDRVPVYETKAVHRQLGAVEEALQSNQKIYGVFTSASTVRAFAENTKDLSYENFKAVCIGPETAREAEKNKMEYVSSKEATMDGIVEALITLVNGTEERI